LKLMWFYAFFDATNTQLFLMFSISEDWISSYRINGSENDSMKNLYNHGILFWYCWIEGTNEKILIYQPYVSLIVLDSAG
jgi:hypothetical protein